MGRVILSFLAILFLSFNHCVAQAKKGYDLGMGIKIGKFSSGITGKYFMNSENNSGIEASITVKKNFGTGLLTGIYIKQFPLFHSQLKIPLDMFVGLGVHAATYKSGYYRIKNKSKDTYYGRGISAGLDAVVGIEYLPAKLPLTFSIEAIPMLDILNPGPEKIELAAACRLIF